jgi:hypothetical protein
MISSWSIRSLSRLVAFQGQPEAQNREEYFLVGPVENDLRARFAAN